MAAAQKRRAHLHQHVPPESEARAQAGAAAPPLSLQQLSEARDPAAAADNRGAARLHSSACAAWPVLRRGAAAATPVCA